MSIPVATHRIRVERPGDPSEVDPWEKGTAAETTTVAEGVRAVIAAPGGITAGGVSATVGDSEAVRFLLLADPCDLNYLDVVVDEDSGDAYSVEWAVASPGLAGLASVRAGLSTYRGFGQEASTE